MSTFVRFYNASILYLEITDQFLTSWLILYTYSTILASRYMVPAYALRQ